MSLHLKEKMKSETAVNRKNSIEIKSNTIEKIKKLRRNTLVLVPNKKLSLDSNK